jgi:hypothetical protein
MYFSSPPNQYEVSYTGSNEGNRAALKRYNERERQAAIRREEREKQASKRREEQDKIASMRREERKKIALMGRAEYRLPRIKEKWLKIAIRAYEEQETIDLERHEQQKKQPLDQSRLPDSSLGNDAGTGHSRTFNKDSLTTVRAKLEEVARSQEMLRETREMLLVERSQVRATGGAVRKQRTVTETTSSGESTTAYEIPIVLSDAKTGPQEPPRQINAIGDYCAKFNFIKEDYAFRLGLKISRKSTRSVIIGSGMKIMTIGTTCLPPFRFQEEMELHSPLFHVVPKCLHNIILGRSFLKITQTFSTLANFARRVKERMTNGVTHQLLYLGDSVPHFSGLINGKPQEALADSGAKVLVMDEDFARRNKLVVDRGAKFRTTLKFADESTAKTSGMARGVRWEFGPGGEGSHTLDFHVLRNAPSDVILSDSFLFSTKAFSKYECFLIDEDDEDGIDEDAFFFAIDVDKRQHSPGIFHVSPSKNLRFDIMFR